MTDRPDTSGDIWADSGRRCRGWHDTISTEPGALDPGARCSGACRDGTRPCPTRQACGLTDDADGRGAIVWPVAVAVAVLCVLVVARCSGPMLAPL